jgi:hypothetical protein
MDVGMEEFKSCMSDDDAEKYERCMREIRLRTNAIEFQARCRPMYKATTIEFACLQIRKILELIALGSLVANKEEYAKQREKFSRDGRAKRILEDIEKINPQFYPYPSKQVIDQKTNKVIEVVPITDGYLTREEFPEVYDACSKALHAANPYGDEIEYASLERSIPIWLSKITKLLNHHQIQLLDKNQQLWVIMKGKDDKPHTYIFARVDPVPGDT